MIAQAHPSVVLLVTHFVNADIVREYRKLRHEAGPQYDVVLLYNQSGAGVAEDIPNDVSVFRCSQSDLARQPYPNKSPVLSAFNVELFPLHYAQVHPWYAHYWVIDHDVRFSGSWSQVLSRFADNGADLLGTTLVRHDFDPYWEYWDSVIPCGDALPRSQWLRGFFPLYRMSAQASRLLDDAYRDGWGGHYEATMPTILAQAGLRIEDIGGNGPFTAAANRGRFYENTPLDANLSPGSLVSRPIRLMAGERPGLLWHPVRTPNRPSWADERQHRLLRDSKSWLRSGAGDSLE